MAFWSYFGDYKTYLGAEFTEMNTDGDVYAPSHQRWISSSAIVKIMPLNAGLVIQSKINALREKTNDAIRVTKESHLKEVTALLNITQD